MADSRKRARAYRSPLREQQRAATRAAVIDAAEDRFVAQGYLATSITEIARTAGVSPETIYATFGSKRALLRQVMDAAAAEITGGQAVIGPSVIDRVRAEPDARRRLVLMGDATREMVVRLGPLEAVVRAAAASDPEIAALAHELDAQKVRDVRRLVGLLAEVGALRMTPREAADVMWALVRDNAFYRNLTEDRGWSHSRAFDALNDAIARVVLSD